MHAHYYAHMQLVITKNLSGKDANCKAAFGMSSATN
jgi:hypothetical protein